MGNAQRLIYCSSSDPGGVNILLLLHLDSPAQVCVKYAPEISDEGKLEVQRVEPRRLRAPVLPTALCELWSVCSSVRCVALDAIFLRISFCMTQNFNTGISSPYCMKVLRI